eukprot:7390925-Prymnesium_polylepis.3
MLDVSTYVSSSTVQVVSTVCLAPADPMPSASGLAQSRRKAAIFTSTVGFHTAAAVDVTYRVGT